MSDSLKTRSPEDEAAASEFYLFSGGPFYRMARRLGLASGEDSLSRIGVFVALATWVPLLILTLVHQFTSGGVAKSFFLSIGTHVRFLVAIPLFFAVEAWSGPRLRSFVGNLVETGIVSPGEVGALREAQDAAMRRRDSWIGEAAILVLTIATLLAGIRTDVTGAASSWRISGSAGSPAGWWYAAVAMPVFQFLLWRWGWRVVIWTLFLRRVSRLNLQLMPTHPDLCGGLGYGAIAQIYISAISIAVSAVLASSAAETILESGIIPPSFLPLVLGVTVINFVIFLGPMLFFMMRMFEVKRRGYREYGILASNYARKFDEKWVHGTSPPTEPLLGTSDIQSLADLGNGFTIVRNMRIVPFGIEIVANLMAFSIVPMLPLFLFKFSIDEIMTKIARLLLGM